MTPGARLQAAIEVLEQIAASPRPADQALRTWGGAHRFAGSKDRKAIADRVYQCLRRPPGAGQDARGRVLGSLALDDGLDAAAIGALFNGQGHAPAALTPEEAAGLAGLRPAALAPFLQDQFEASFGADWRAELDSLLSGRAPLDLRVNTIKAGADQALAALAEAGIEAKPAPLSALGLRLESGEDVAGLDAFQDGLFEVQDEASQIAALLLDAQPGETVIDYCAGGGGKTLALGQTMAGQGRLIACDVEYRRLEAIAPRLQRAGVKAELRPLGSQGEGLEALVDLADRVLVDAPCSASGTWRRRPEQAWRLTEDELGRLGALQAAILGRAADLVRPGGRLAYVTCSVLAAENTAVIKAFAQARPDFKPLPIQMALATPLLTPAGRSQLAEWAAGRHWLQMSPRRTHTDGFFIALFERTS